MSIFQSKLGKQKQPEHITEINNGESETLTGKNFEQRKSEFMEEIIFDEKNLLDPRRYQGENINFSILRALGVNEKILKNPTVRRDMSNGHTLDLLMQRLVKQQGVEDIYNKLEMGEKQIKESDVEGMIWKLDFLTDSNNMILDSTKRMEEYGKNIGIRQAEYKNAAEHSDLYNFDDINKNVEKIDLRVDEKTGDFTIGSLRISAIDPACDTYQETKYSLDSKDNVIKEDMNSHGLPKGGEHFWRDDSVMINEEGIEVEGQFIRDFEDEYTCTKATRDAEFPFVAEEETVHRKNGEKTQETTYMPINLEEIYSLSKGIGQADKQYKILRFNTREQVLKYYEENKQSIENAFRKNKSMQKLAMETGILSNEAEQVQS